MLREAINWEGKKRIVDFEESQFWRSGRWREFNLARSEAQ